MCANSSINNVSNHRISDSIINLERKKEILENKSSIDRVNQIFSTTRITRNTATTNQFQSSTAICKKSVVLIKLQENFETSEHKEVFLREEFIALAKASKGFKINNKCEEIVDRVLIPNSLNIIKTMSSRSIAAIIHSYSTIIFSYPKLKLKKNRSFILAFANAAIEKIDQFESRGIANLAWAFAKLNMEHPDLFKELATAAIKVVGQFNSQGIANLAWAFARLNIEHPDLFKELATAAIKVVDQFNPRDIANLAWAFARLNIEHPALFKRLATAAIEIVEQFTAQGIANLAWAFARLNIEHPALFKGLATAAIEIVEQFTSQGIANLAWAFARLNIEHPALFKRLATAAIEIIGQFNPQEIANLAWAFATLNIEHPALFKRLATVAIEIVGQFNPQEIANLAWAFARLNIEHPALFKRLATAAIEIVGQFNPQEIANLAWAFATLNIEHPALFKRLATAAIEIVGQFNPQEIANLAWAFATLNIEHPALFKRLATAAIEIVGQFNPQEIANLAWATTYQNDNSKEIATLFMVLIKKIELIPTSKFSDSSLSQLNTVQIIIASRKSNLRQEIQFRLPIPIEEAIRRMLDRKRTQTHNSSNIHLSLSSDLNHFLGSTTHCNEFFIEGFFLDIAFAKEKVAIEVDGTTHFLHNIDEVNRSDQASYRGHNKMKDRILNLLGWDILRVSTQSLKNPIEKQQFLNQVQNLLANKSLKKGDEEKKVFHLSSSLKVSPPLKDLNEINSNDSQSLSEESIEDVYENSLEYWNNLSRDHVEFFEDLVSHSTESGLFEDEYRGYGSNDADYDPQYQPEGDHIDKNDQLIVSRTSNFSQIEFWKDSPLTEFGLFEDEY